MRSYSTYKTSSPVNKVTGCLLLISFLSACSLNVNVDQLNTITQEDVEAVSQIIGESLSDENSGITGSLYDAITDITASGFVPGSNWMQETGHDEKSGRGQEQNISYSYNNVTGEHRLSFERTVTRTGFIKEVTDTVQYVYTDESGQYIASPETESARIKTINFKGSRHGTIETPYRTSFFVRRDTFLIDGLGGSSGPLIIDGVHRGNGSFRGISSADSSVIERNYELEVNFLNLELNQAILEQTGVEQAIKGALTYSLMISDPNTANVSRTVRGSIDLVGDGTATLRVTQQESLFLVNLDNGEVSNQQKEFEGKVSFVNSEESIFTLASGLKVQVNSNTVIDLSGDLFTLEAVKNALLQGDEVRAEGEGSLNGNLFLATEVEFELDDDVDSENNDISFNHLVEEVNLEASSFTLSNAVTIHLDENSLIDPDSDLENLEQVKNAIQEQFFVRAVGDARYVNEGDTTYIVEEVLFVLDDEEGPEEVINFDGLIEDINLEAQFIKLKNGALIRISDATEIKGDFESLEEAKESLNAGFAIEADGYGVEDPESEADILAIRIDLDKVH